MTERHGVTVLEVVIVMAIIALLAALLVPAVQSARESSRRNTCRVRLKDLGIALHAYEAARQEYPPALAPVPQRFRPSRFRPTDYSPQARLLGHLDQGPLFESIDLELPTAKIYDPADESANPRQTALQRTRVLAFICPSDDRGDPVRPGCNYCVCIGRGPYWFDVGPQTGFETGAFTGRRARRPAEVHDGLSQTVAMSERLTGGWDPSTFSRERDFWYSGISVLLGADPPLDEMVEVCSSLSTGNPEFYPFSGSTWLISGYPWTWYNHAVTPNSPVPPCADQTAPENPRGPPLLNGGVFSASSHHPGGVNCLFLDGSVRFVSNHIDVGVWRASATRAGSEAVSVAAF